MLRRIKVVPLAAESLGVRSMSTYVETPDVKILLDAGASLGPKRFGFPPHRKEYKAIAECRERISKAAKKAEVVTLSHYHFDHHTPSYVDWCYNWSSEESAKEIYEEKIVFAKSYRTKVNYSQRRRGWMFEKTSGKHAEKLMFGDGKEFNFGETKLRFSNPVFHGPEGSTLGWVLMTTIQKGDEKVLFAPDVQGPMYIPALKMILSETPQLVLVGGPPLYLTRIGVAEEHIDKGMKNLQKLIEKVPTTILDHHILRDERWAKLSQPLWDTASKSGHTVVTAAEFLGKQNRLLESHRKQLFEVEPPCPEFEKWIKLPPSKRKLTKPPIFL